MQNLRWGWIALGGFLGELVAIVVLMGLRVLNGSGPISPAPLSPLALAAFLTELAVVMALFGWWVAARKAHAQRVLHGLLVGVAAVLIYEILAFGQPVPRDWSYVAAHALKIAGGAVGGWLATWLGARAALPTAAS
jgi:hypothetical protein